MQSDVRLSIMYIPYIFVVLVAAASGQQQEGDACVDQYTNAAGICKPVDQCETAKVDLQESGITPTFCSRMVFGSSLVCCRDGLTIFETPVTARTVKVPAASDDTQTLPARRRGEIEKQCKAYTGDARQGVDYLLLFPEPEIFYITVAPCFSQDAPLPSEFTELREFPHMGALGWRIGTNRYLFQCGGSLISINFVLTAARCRVGKPNENANLEEPVIVRLGDQNLDDTVYDGASPLDYSIRRIHVHPDYKPPNRFNDIALVQLARPVNFDMKIRPACLSTQSAFSGLKVIATGWNTHNKRTPDQAMKKAAINVLENDLCDRALFMQQNKWSSKRVNETEMCAGVVNEPWDSCLMEAGSPLQVLSEEKECVFHIVAIATAGIRCAESNQPAVYTRVAPYLDWIEQTVWPLQ